MHFQESTCLYDLWMRLACNIDWFIRSAIISSTYFSLPTYVTALFSDLFRLSFYALVCVGTFLVHGSITQLLFEKKDAVQ